MQFVKGLNGSVKVVLLALFAVVGMAVPSFAATESLIDFATIAADIMPLMKAAITTAAGVGVVVLAAKLCWNFFKRFVNG